jgi:hypothetical protein
LTDFGLRFMPILDSIEELQKELIRGSEIDQETGLI